jgi:4-alpha-glucanotransferase
MIRAIWSSVAMFTLAPMQDFLSLGTEGRMNMPGRPGGNWTWRVDPEDLTEELAARIRETNFLYSRVLGTEMAEPGKAIKISPKAKDQIQA